jgi:hypothetical protein
MNLKNRYVDIFAFETSQVLCEEVFDLREYAGMCRRNPHCIAAKPGDKLAD